MYMYIVVYLSHAQCIHVCLSAFSNKPHGMCFHNQHLCTQRINYMYVYTYMLYLLQLHVYTCMYMYVYTCCIYTCCIYTCVCTCEHEVSFWSLHVPVHTLLRHYHGTSRAAGHTGILGTRDVETERGGWSTWLRASCRHVRHSSIVTLLLFVHVTTYCMQP